MLLKKIDRLMKKKIKRRPFIRVDNLREVNYAIFKLFTVGLKFPTLVY